MSKSNLYNENQVYFNVIIKWGTKIIIVYMIVVYIINYTYLTLIIWQITIIINNILFCINFNYNYQ